MTLARMGLPSTENMVYSAATSLRMPLKEKSAHVKVMFLVCALRRAPIKPSTSVRTVLTFAPLFAIALAAVTAVVTTPWRSLSTMNASAIVTWSKINSTLISTVGATADSTYSRCFPSSPRTVSNLLTSRDVA